MSTTGSQLIYYVTGHGYGHARRAAEVIRSLIARCPDLTVHVRTSGPAWIFADLGRRVHYEPVLIDCGAVEDDPLRLNWPATIRNVAAFRQAQPALVASEAAFIRQTGVSLIVADIPFVAGYIAEAAGVPCLAVGNFTWDWVYEPYLPADDGRYPGLLEHIRGGYRRMQALLRLPLAHANDLFGHITDVPLIARTDRRPTPEVLRQIGIDERDPRQRILIGMRGGITPQSLQALAAGDRGFLFLYAEPTDGPLPSNVCPIRWSQELNFWDVLNTCDAVVAKLGHGIVTDCAASRTSLLWPARTGFREDPLVISQIGPYFRAREIPVPDFLDGRWSDHLHRLLEMPRPQGLIATAGATTCAALIAQRLPRP